jgi:hypothetical protein
VFTANGSYQSGQQFVDGMNAAIIIGAALVAVGAIAALRSIAPHGPRLSRPLPTLRC